MNRFRINRIGIKNFKIFSEYKELPLNSSDLVVFDGPNGFGKTSVFDSVELALTGKIKRLDLYDDSVKNTKVAHGFYPFVNNDQSEFYIKVELVTKDASLVICRFLDINNVKDKGRGKINWSGIGLRRLENWDDPYNSGTLLTQKDLEGLLGAPDLERVFNVFFYVQQEENTFFLKRSEGERKEYLNVLFDVDRETKTLGQIKDILKVHKEYIKEKEEQVKALNATIVSNGSIDITSNVEPYSTLFSEGAFEWDKEVPDFSKMKMESIELGLKELGELVENEDAFKRQRGANEIRSFMATPDFFQSFVLHEVYANNFKEIEDQVKYGNDVRAFSDGLKSKRYLDVQFWEKYRPFTIGLTNVSIDLIIQNISEYQKAERSYSGLEKSRGELLRLREQVLSRFKDYLSHQTDPKEGECPLCGQDWGDLQKLTDAVALEEQRFLNQNQNVLKGYLDTIDNFVKQVEVDLDKYRMDNYFPPESIVVKMRTAGRAGQIYQKLRDYLAANGLPFDFTDELSKIEDLPNLDATAKKFQEQLVSFINNERTIPDETFAGWESYFVRHFQENFDNFKKISSDKIDTKLKYIKVKFGEFLKSKNEETFAKISKIDTETEKVKARIDNLKQLKELYEKEIRSHITRIINDISIPFYINSGRILQEFHGGNGIFVRMGEKQTEGVKFFTDVDPENDPLYSLSSGQISSLVLAFCLTLNDVYRSHYLGMLLIDDPVQTMDEINTVTFIDLIRTSFQDRQFLISTHEDNFSSLIRYKFKQVESQISVVRMKEVI